MSLAVAHRPRPVLGWRGDAGADLGWLASEERQVYGRVRDGSRRQAWLDGRRLAKEVLLTRALGWSPTPAAAARLEICSRDGLGRAIAPRVLVDGQMQPWSLSIAHSEASVLVALSCERGVGVGADLVPRGAFGAHGLDAWLTPREAEWLSRVPDGERPAGASILWAIKEATYKAAGGGTRFVPRRVEARAGADSWHALIDDRSIAAAVGITVTDTDVAAVVVVGGPGSDAWP
jgi:phosphopantetheinyl transferase